MLVPHRAREQRAGRADVVHVGRVAAVLVGVAVQMEAVAGDRLGLAEDLEQVHALAADVLQHRGQPLRDVGPAEGDDPHGARAVRHRIGADRLGEGAEHLRRAAVVRRGPFTGDRRPPQPRASGRRPRMSVPPETKTGSVRHRSVDVVDRREEAADAQVALVRDPAREREREAVRGEVRVAVRLHHPLGHGGRARGEEDLPDVVAVDGDVRLGGRLIAHEVRVADAPIDDVPADGDGDVDLQPRGGDGAADPGPQLRVDHDEARRAALDEVADHVPGELRVHRHHDHPRLADGDLGDERLDGVLADEQHAVAPRSSPRARSPPAKRLAATSAWRYVIRSYAGSTKAPGQPTSAGWSGRLQVLRSKRSPAQTRSQRLSARRSKRLSTSIMTSRLPHVSPTSLSVILPWRGRSATRRSPSPRPAA